MHMNSAPHLLTEDRPEFERILDEALRTAHERPELSGIGDRLNAVQLRTMVLAAGTFVTERAAAEYENYVKAREELRAPSTGTAHDSVLAPAEGVPLEPSGAGVGAVVAVLAPVLAGTAAAIFLLVGYILKMLNPVPAFADTMLTAGWFFGALTAAAILAAAVGLLITAVRNGATQVVAIDEDSEADAPDERTQEFARAREAWRHALLERGIYPFLRDALADPSVDPGAPAPRRPIGRIPTLGYDRPGFDSPDEGASPTSHPSFTSPDFTSPDFGGPEHQPD
ncbi:hypothetical protein ACFYZ9_00775 [Streptomyces sp. NPDC001691]|uniref:hypothetical protein n=1 Tax=unclassified Streptomyces TaxID=2593676 RepID=UPI000DEAEFA2|nr:hypothetical protein [Streptomyces sp. SDr-06]RCH66480.1 hypothetical protein DT019_22590 [Streptomyces sp. SDr-06]